MIAAKQPALAKQLNELKSKEKQANNANKLVEEYKLVRNKKVSSRTTNKNTELPKKDVKKSRITRIIAKPVKEKRFRTSVPKNLPKKVVSEVPPEILLQEQFEKLKRSDRMEIPTGELDAETATKYSAFANKYVNQSKNGDPIDVTIGFDMGTSSSKVLVRLPYEGNKIAAFPVPKVMRMDKLPNLWKTIIYIHPVSGLFSLFPKYGYEAITAIKTTLMHECRDDEYLYSGDKIQCSATEAAIAYLAMMLRYIGGWALSEAFSRDIHNPIWTLNLGLPAAKMEETALLNTYRKIQKIAWSVSLEQAEISMELVKSAINKFDMSTLSINGNNAFNIVPEVIAEANGIVNSRYFEEGNYLIVDVGASTLDICLFNSSADYNGNSKFAIYQSDVKLFGVLAQQWLSEVNGTEEQLSKAIRTTLGTLVIDVKTKRDPNSSVWENKLPVLLCGGGKGLKLYREALNSLHKTLREVSTKFRGLEKIELNAPQELLSRDDVQEFHRLAVACGLSDPDCEWLDIKLAKEISDIGRAEVKDFSSNYAGAEHV